VAEDINGDEIPDLVVASLGTYRIEESQTLDVFLGNGDGTFRLNQSILAGAENEPYGIAAADLRGTGALDIIVPNKKGNTVSVYLSRGDGLFDNPKTYATGDSWSVSAADIDGDGAQDLAVGNFDSQTLSILPGVGDGSFKPALTIAATAGMKPRAVEFGDFDRDGRADMVVPSDTVDGRLAVFINKSRPGRIEFIGPQIIRVGSGTGAAVIHDLDSDGILDVLVSSQASNHVSVLMGRGDGTFEAPVNYWSGDVWPFYLGLADFNGDGAPDLVGSGVKGARVPVLSGDGQGRFGGQYEIWVEGPSRWVATADFNLDGRMDIGAGNYTLTGALEHDPALFFKTVSVLLNRIPAGDVVRPVFRVNCGGETFTTSSGLVYRSDAGFEGGDVVTAPGRIEGTEDPELYRSAREGRFAYTARLAPGRSYTVRLHFAESRMKKAGKRKFDIVINGQPARRAFDIMRHAPKNTAKVVDLYRVWPDKEGLIKIDFVPAKKGAICSAISIF
jgi:hypothetical protein